MSKGLNPICDQFYVLLSQRLICSFILNCFIIEMSSEHTTAHLQYIVIDCKSAITRNAQTSYFAFEQ